VTVQLLTQLEKFSWLLGKSDLDPHIVPVSGLIVLLGSVPENVGRVWIEGEWRHRPSKRRNRIRMTEGLGILLDCPKNRWCHDE